MAGAEGRALSIRGGSASSFLTSSSSFSFPFRDLPEVRAGVEVCDAFCLPFPLSLTVLAARLDANKLADTERVNRFVGVSGSSDSGGVINCFETAAAVGVDSFTFCPRVEITERKGVDWLLLEVEGTSSADDREVRADDERAVIAGDSAVRAEGAGDAIPGVSGVGREEGPATAWRAELDCARDGGSDVRSEAESTSATSSISPPPTTSFGAEGRGRAASSASLSLSSESSPSGITAYTPRRVRRSFRFSPGFLRSPSELDSFESESDSKSEPESDSESELIGGSSSV